MNNFNIWLPFLWEAEGGIADHAWDPGGLTNHGVTIATWRHYAKPLFGVDGTPETLRTITAEQRTAIAFEYWKDANCALFKCPALQIAHADYAYQSGNRYSTLRLQMAVNSITPSLAEDGVLGPMTIKAANSLPPKTLLDGYLAARRRHYENLVAASLPQAPGIITRVDILKKYLAKYVPTTD